MSRHLVPVATCLLLLGSSVLTWAPRSVLGQGLPPVPFPPENPITEEKRVLGKILFWDEQLSSDDTVACGTCHFPADAGADARFARHPGADGVFLTNDDVIGSAGVVRRDSSGQPVADPWFGFDPQVTRRSAQPIFMSAYAPEAFWDGSAPSTFLDPLTGDELIAQGGGLESQSVSPILSSIEMAKEGRTWTEVIAKLQGVAPLALATDLPADIQSALMVNPSYADLFTAAFGDPAIEPKRIAFALATYERTLVPDQTPWDLGTLTPLQQQGFSIFASTTCRSCHFPPAFSDFSYRNTGVRPASEDLGRQIVTGQSEDAGRFKIPSLRNVGIKKRFFHNGALTNLSQVLDFYLEVNGQQQFPGNLDPLVEALVVPEPGIPALLEFLQNGLTDPRVAAEQFPFDRPTLASEQATAAPLPRAPTLEEVWPAAPNPANPSAAIRYRLARASNTRFTVFDLRGRRIREIALGLREAGEHVVSWDGRDDAGGTVGSGVYVYRVSAGGDSLGGELVLVQ